LKDSIYFIGEIVIMNLNDPQPSANGDGTEKPKKKFQGIVYLKPERCKGCGFCIAFCPPHVLAFAKEFNSLGYHAPRLEDPEGCTGCDLCGMYCPDFAIHAVMMKYDSPTLRPMAPAGRGSKR
jgi:2-oxoglutarate ferredoxin oxidoreductase subunit delta